LVAGHLLIVSGLLLGYRGVWRAMVGARGVAAATARRLWPAEASGRRDGDGEGDPTADRPAPTGAGSQRHRD